MKFTWTEDDIVCGRVVCKTYTKELPFTPNGNSAKWTHKIGWISSVSSKNNLVLIALTDGMVCGTYTAPELISRLNDCEYQPMPWKWHVQIVEWLEDSYDRFVHSPFNKTSK